MSICLFVCLFARLKAKQKELGNFDLIVKIDLTDKITQLKVYARLLVRETDDTKIYDKRISSVIDLLRLWNLLVCTTLNVSPIMNVLLLVAQVMHEVVVVEGNSVSVLLFEGSLFLFFYYITTALWKHAAACSAGKSGYAEVISMIASTCRGRIACAVMNLSRETKTNST
ncbi:hypothetical protein T09_6444 [Trichinella sp. T9]|nr:hypothetical protein T09_6444 [Trichinella sp. T9]